MSNVNCTKCGEEYSNTYRKCPFCQEEAALKKGRPIRRKGKRLEKRKRGGAGGIILLLAVIIVFGVVGYVFFGDQVANLAGIRTDEDRSDLSQIQGDKDPADQQKPQDDQQKPAEGDTTTTTPETTVPAGPLTLDFTTLSFASGQTARITATGGTGEITWSTSNEHIATVDNGSITGLAGGTVVITAKSGEETATCTVIITGDPWVSDVKLSLNKSDVTVRSVDPPTFKLKITGGEHGAVTWASKNTNVATVSDDGTVKRVGKGTTTVTATVDGQVLECIVRCS